MTLLAQQPLWDIVIYGLLVWCFHRNVYKSLLLCSVIAALTLIKVALTSSLITMDVFWLAFNLLLFGALFLGLYFMRHSPNYFWLFSGLLVIKLVDVSLFSLLGQQGVWHYVWFLVADGVALLLLDQRQNFVYWLAQRDWGEISQAARNSVPKQDLAYQETLIMVVYWVSILFTLAILVEYGVNQFTGEVLSTVAYQLSPHVKLILSLFELILLFNMATGHAISLIKRKRVW